MADGLVQGDPTSCLEWNILMDQLLYLSNTNHQGNLKNFCPQDPNERCNKYAIEGALES